MIIFGVRAKNDYADDGGWLRRRLSTAEESWDVCRFIVSWEAQTKRQPNLLCLTY